MVRSAQNLLAIIQFERMMNEIECREWSEMESFQVVVRNELTGEEATITVECAVACEAQTQALIELFRTRGWRKARALQPDCLGPAQVVAEAS